MTRQTRSARVAAFGITLCAVALAAAAACGARPASPDTTVESAAIVMRAFSSQPADEAPGPRYMAGDAHTHTWLSPDGRHTESEVASRAFAEFGLDWITATDHGGIVDPHGHRRSDQPFHVDVANHQDVCLPRRA